MGGVLIGGASSRRYYCRSIYYGPHFSTFVLRQVPNDFVGTYENRARLLKMSIYLYKLVDCRLVFVGPSC